MKWNRNRSIAIGIAASLLIGFGIGFGAKGKFDCSNTAFASEAAPVSIHRVQDSDIIRINKMLGPNLWDVCIDPLFMPLSLVTRPLPVVPLLAFPSDTPKVQTKDGDKELQVIVQVPGMNEKDIDIQVSDYALTVKWQKVSQQKNSALFSSTNESFQQTLQLPCKVVADKVQATVKDGILTVSLPKFEAKNL